MHIYSVTDPEFKAYGKVLEGYDTAELVEAMERIGLPEQGTAYEPGIASLEACTIFSELQDRAYGGMPIQIGFCNGFNHTLNAVEYHRDSELNYACTDLILLLGKRSDIEKDFSYDTSKMQAFLVRKGTLVEIYATTLHYAPISATPDGTFRCTVVLPRGTNEPLPERGAAHTDEDKLLTHVNKWLIAHPESGLDKTGAFVGLKGENITI